MKKTKIDVVISLIKDQIENKTLLQGAKLLSVRQLAHQMQYSLSTVIEAYARLVADGSIEARAGSGYFVCKKVNNLQLIQPVQYKREVDPLWISRQSLDASSETIKAGCGWLPTDWMPEQSIRRALKKVAHLKTATLVDYSNSQDNFELRAYIARKNENYDLNLDPSHILITDSATQSIDLIFRQLLNAGDTILIDDPCYFNFLALINVHHIKAIAIPFLENGPDIESFENGLKYHPKLYITNSGIHNPTGAGLTLQTAYQIAKLAEQANLKIVEDDIFADFEFAPAPRYSSLMGLKHVIQIGSFSKSVSASVRCGYIATDHENLEKLIDLKIATTFTNGNLSAAILHQVLVDPAYKKHLENLRHRLLKNMQESIVRLKQLDIEVKIIPRAGLFLWAELPNDIDAITLSKLCLEKGVVLAPGQAFSQSDSAKCYLRFNVAQCQQAKVYQVLHDAMHEIRIKKLSA